MNRVIGINYELKDLDSGNIIESNFESNPLYFISGFNHIIKELEEGVLDLKENEERKIKLSQDAMGKYDSSLIQAYPKEDFAGINLYEGMELTGQGENGEIARAIVIAIGEDEVMMDFNNPLVGKSLEFNVKVVENRLATNEEISMQKADVLHTCGCGKTKKSDHKCCGGSGHDDSEHECCGGHSGKSHNCRCH